MRTMHLYLEGGNGTPQIEGEMSGMNHKGSPVMQTAMRMCRSPFLTSKGGMKLKLTWSGDEGGTTLFMPWPHRETKGACCHFRTSLIVLLGGGTNLSKSGVAMRNHRLKHGLNWGSKWGGDICFLSTIESCIWSCSGYLKEVQVLMNTTRRWKSAMTRGNI